jgi:hypothetical protein
MLIAESYCDKHVICLFDVEDKVEVLDFNINSTSRYNNEG